MTLGPLIQAGNLVAARLWEKSGDPNRALAAVRRRVRLVGGPELYATYLREEGRLAAATGDREGAALAYRRYLTLRENAEPSLQPQVVRCALSSHVSSVNGFNRDKYGLASG